MHELAVARSLIELVCDRAGNRPVERIRIRLGVLSGLTRPLMFCFEAAARGTCCQGALLEIDEVPLTVYCASCDAEHQPLSLFSFLCPDCGSPTPEIRTGREMQVVSIQLAAGAAAHSLHAIGQNTKGSGDIHDGSYH